MDYMKAPNGEPILLIEYFDNVPHAVYTTLSNFDFDMHKDEWLMFYESGGGQNNHFDIGNYVNPEKWKVWIRPDFGGTIEINQTEVNLIKKPIRLKSKYSHIPQSSINPFVIGEEVSEIVYCSRCESNLSDMCDEHQYWCENDSLIKYQDTNEVAE